LRHGCIASKVITDMAAVGWVLRMSWPL